MLNWWDVSGLEGYYAMSFVPLPSTFSVTSLHLARTLTFLHSVALAVAIQRHTHLEWKEDKESQVLNAIYRAMFWKGRPGVAEITQDWRKIEFLQDQTFDQYVRSFCKKLSEGPRAVISYLELLNGLRDDAVGFVKDTFADANQINAEIANETKEAVGSLAKIKLGSNVALAVMSGGIGVWGSGGMAFAATGVTLGSKVVGVVAKNLTSGKDAQAIAIDTGFGISKEVAMAGSEHRLHTGAEYVQARARLQVWKQIRNGATAEQKINVLSRDLARKVSNAKIAKLNRQIGRAQIQVDKAAAGRVTASRLAGATRLVGKAIPVVFAVHDIIEAVSEYREDVGAAEAETR
jgi:hypothetical protein